MTESSKPLYALDPGSELPPRLLELFLRSGPEQMQGVVDACVARDSDAARAGAHKLKGSLYAVGATPLGDSLEALRMSIAQADWPTADRRLTEAAAEFERLLSELQRQLAQARS